MTITQTATSQKFGHTPLAGSGLSILANSKQREFAKWVEAKEVRKEEWMAWLGGPSMTFKLWDEEIGQSYAPFTASTLGAQAGNSDEQITVASTALFLPGDQGFIKEYYSDSTTEFDDTRSEPYTVITVDSTTLMTVKRHQGEVADGSYYVHPTGSVITVQGRAQTFLEPFPDGYTFRGDSFIVHPQRMDSPEITYDEAAVRTPDFEAPNGHWASDVKFWKDKLLHYRDWTFINGRKVTGDHLSSPKIPYQASGCVWFAEQLAGNLAPVNGLLNFFDFTDIAEDLAINHKDGQGDAAWMHPRVRTIYNEMLLPYKGMFGAGDSALNMTVSSVKNAYGSIPNPMTDNQWPPSKILLTSKSDWKWGPADGRDWQYAERDRSNLGMWAKSWSMSGDFGQVCTNISHQRLLTGIDTRKNLYPARSMFL